MLQKGYNSARGEVEIDECCLGQRGAKSIVLGEVGIQECCGERDKCAWDVFLGRLEGRTMTYSVLSLDRMSLMGLWDNQVNRSKGTKPKEFGKIPQSARPT